MAVRINSLSLSCNNNDMKNKMIVLESVGGVLINGVVYAQWNQTYRELHELGEYDEESGVELSECDEEFYEALSDEDLELIKNNQ